ncbi:MAG: transaldolase [Coleofasciculus sp. A1-SPW-01]|uniref:transaldolase n=1 Tax=Coleofasciculus sp. A1-SPW-01 TaxID=3070819 RepID=UPI0032FBA503
MANNPIFKIKEYGQSIWMDYLDRQLIESGELKNKIETRGISGITSNPKSFAKAVSNNRVYDSDIEAGIKGGKSTSEIYESLIFEDIRNACDIFRPIYDESGGTDGFVSIEVSPHLARDTQRTVEEARRFFRAIDRDNVFIKIPGTKEGFPAIEQAISEGINVNITLLFSVESYVESAWAYVRGLEARVAAGKPIENIASVASFFLSRIDTKVDNRIDERLKRIGTEELNEEARLRELKGKVAIANAKVAYQRFKEIIESDRFKALAEQGANIQRVLWASTSTKNPDYSDVMYVNELIGQNTINTLPPDTIEACEDHADVAPNRVETEADKAQKTLESLGEPDIQIDYDQVMAELVEEGIEKFAKPFDSLMKSIEEKAEQLTPV